MNMKNTKLKEDAKSDWMKLVKHHKKRQKGLPALSKLNTDAGNVEHNVSMFNKMSSAVDAASNNPVSGPFGGDVATGEGMGEALNSHKHENTDTVDKSAMLYEVYENSLIELEYEHLPIEVVTRAGRPGGYYDTGFGNWLPDDDKTSVIYVDWSYPVEKQDIVDVLGNDADVQDELKMEELTSEEFEVILQQNFDSLLQKHMSTVLNFFKDSAIEDAEEHYDYKFYDESIQKSVNNFDDKFDMSMRSLL